VRHFIRGDGELIGLAGADQEMALAAVPNFAGDRKFKKTVFKSINKKFLQTIQRLAGLPADDSFRGGRDRCLNHCAETLSCSWLGREHDVRPRYDRTKPRLLWSRVAQAATDRRRRRATSQACMYQCRWRLQPLGNRQAVIKPNEFDALREAIPMRVLFVRRVRMNMVW